MPTPNEITTQMVQALSISEPDLDVGVGTPIRKVLDVVAEAISEAYLDRYLLQYQYDIDAKSGPDLDSFVALFGFARLPAKRASGTVLLQRNSPAPSSIAVPLGSQVSTVDNPPIIVQTSAPSVFPAGAISATVSVQSVVGGASSNVSAGTLIRWLTPIEGIVAVTNPAAMTGGADAETDDQLRERFKRSIFRNLAGTQDMYLGVALNDPDCTSAVVIGATARWREQIQIVSGTATSTILSPTAPSFAINNASNATPISIGTPSAHPFIAGDIVKIQGVLGNTAANGTWRVKAVVSSTTFTISKLDGSGDAVGSGAYTGGTGTYTVIDRAKYIYDTGYAFGPNIDAGQLLIPGVHYTLNTTTIPPIVTSLDAQNCPDGVYDLTYNYCPLASRNDPALGITNRVDVYTAGSRSKVATETVIYDGSTVVQDYGSNPLTLSRWRRPNGALPVLGDPIVRLSFAPLIDVPNVLPNIGTLSPVEGTNFFMLNEVNSQYKGWDSYSALEIDKLTLPILINISGATNASPIVLTVLAGHNYTAGMRVKVFNGTGNTAMNGIWTISATTSTTITLSGTTGNGAYTGGGQMIAYHPITFSYTYNAIPRDVQVAIETWRLLGQDVKLHAGNQANLKLYVAVILRPGYTSSSISAALNTAVQTYLSKIGFGGLLQISDLLSVMAAVTGIDAVRLLNSGDMPALVNVTSATTATPNQLTTSANHGLSPGDLILVEGILGQVTANGTWIVQTTPSSTTLTLKGSSGGAAYTSGGTIVRANYAIQRLEDDNSTIRTGYATSTLNVVHRPIDIQFVDNEFPALSSIVISVKAQNTFGQV